MEGTTLEQMDALMHDYALKRKDYEEKKQVASQLKKTMDDAEWLVTKALHESNKMSYRVDGLGLFSLISTETIKTPKTIEDKRELYDYIEAKYGQDVLDGYRSIHSGTLNSFYKEELKECADPALFSLPGIDGVTVRQSTRFTKAKV